MTGSQMDQEIAGVVARRAATANDLDTPPTQELPVELADAPSGLSRARRRYVALAAAVRDHELRSSHSAVPKRPADHALYAALTELEPIAPVPGDQLR